MKTLNITFDDKEYKKLNNAKELISIINAKELSWHDFILRVAEIHDKKIMKGYNNRRKKIQT